MSNFDDFFDKRATQAEAEAGTDNFKAMTPLRTKQSITDNALTPANNLSDVAAAATAFNNIKQIATEESGGVVERATQAEAEAGADNLRHMTPLRTTQAIASKVQTKKVTSTVSNGTETLSDITGLTGINIVNGRVYEITILIDFLAANLGQSIDFKLDVDVSNVGAILFAKVNDGSNTPNPWERTIVPGILFTPTLDSTNSFMMIHGTWVANATGTVSMQFAKGGASGGSAQIFEDSTMIFREVG